MHSKVRKIECECPQAEKITRNVGPSFAKYNDDRAYDDVEKIKRPDPQDAADVEILDVDLSCFLMLQNKQFCEKKGGKAEEQIHAKPTVGGEFLKKSSFQNGVGIMNEHQQERDETQAI